MGFTLKPGLVRGDLYNLNGKWKYTVAIDMSDYYNVPDLQLAVKAAYMGTPENVRGVVDGVTGMWLVVLEPYHKHSHPQAVAL